MTRTQQYSSILGFPITVNSSATRCACSEIQNHDHLFDNNLRCFVSYHPDVSKIEYEKKQEQLVEQTKQKPKQVATQGHSKDSSCTPTSPQMRAYAGSTPQQRGDVRILSVEEPTDATTRQVI